MRRIDREITALLNKPLISGLHNDMWGRVPICWNSTCSKRFI